MPAPYPLLLRPVVLEKVWGGRRLESLGKELPRPGAKYGESWELADMGATSASGAGGEAVRSVITNGALRGKTLHEAMEVWGAAMLERSPGSESRGTRDFPLLIKFLDASENLSVQVHPSPAYAAANAGAHLKTECWYIIDADPGAVIYKGIRPGVRREEFSRLASAGDVKLVDALVAIPAAPGECHNLPSGTVHALGAGVLVAEVQTPSDTTFRLYDWGRAGREMHVEQALKCASFPGEPGHEELLRGMTVERLADGQAMTRLVTTDFFAVDELRPKAGDVLAIGAGGRSVPAVASGACIALVVVEDECELVGDARAFQPVALKRGDTALIPAAIVERTLLAAGDNLRVLRTSVS